MTIKAKVLFNLLHHLLQPDPANEMRFRFFFYKIIITLLCIMFYAKATVLFTNLWVFEKSDAVAGQDDRAAYWYRATANSAILSGLLLTRLVFTRVKEQFLTASSLAH